MANETLEFDIIVNGTKAKTSIEEVEAAQDSLEKKTTKSTKTMSTDWVGMGTKVAAVAAVMATVSKAALEYERATFGMTKTTKDYITQASSQLGVNRNLIANYVQTGKSAGLAGTEIAKMIDTAVALGRKYPNESTESFIDNLSMLNRTGEAQGYIVDVLEQKYGAIDLKTLSLSEKMAALDEATLGVNEEFAKTNVSKFDSFMADAQKGVVDLGEALIEIAEDTGAFWLLNKAIKTAGVGLAGLSLIAKSVKIGFKTFFGADTNQDIKDFTQTLEDAGKTWDSVLGKLPEGGAVGVTAPTIKGKAKPKEQTVIESQAKTTKADLKMAESSWQTYYEKIGDLESAWNSKSLQLKSQYKDLNTEQMAEMLEISKTEYFEKFGTLMEDQLKDTKTLADQMSGYFDDTFSKDLSSSLLEGEESIKSFFTTLITEMARAQLQATITNPLTSGLSSIVGSLFGGTTSSEIGGVSSLGSLTASGYAQGGVSGTRLAQGGVISSPTKMRFAQGGTGLVGERNRAEGVLPLSRTSSGDLGVMTTGGSGTSTQNMADVNITINAIDTQTGVSFLLANKDAIEGIINNSLSTNGTVRANL